ncbi:hypothetical protein AGLY_006575 [Aphis glycines]|uniref:Uncharacterized protein n=1 Tax=Aphis glycines TaxID=307491 RepID=A0A6G0TS04_APHGL|nr:hypothetical protein AGLY_006575 [Aphis glycines]
MNSKNLGSQPRKSLSNRTSSSISLNKGNAIQNKPNTPTKTKNNTKTVTNTLSCTHNINNKTGLSLSSNHTTTTHTPFISSATTHSTIPTYSVNSHATNNDNTLFTDKNTNNKLYYALATSNSNTPKREQAIVLHPIDGLLLKDYIIAIGQIISPSNIIFAGIKEAGYEHILSFRRQIYIKHEDIPKLPGSLLINLNETNFRIFFTDDTITCYTYKSIGNTSMSCNKNITDNQNLSQSLNQQNTLTYHSNVFTDVNIKLLENTLPPEILPFKEQLTKNQMEWSDDAQYPPLANTALINPESTQHTSNLVESPQQTINAENL